MFCSKCGQSNPDGAAFCLSCGKSLIQGEMAPPSADQGVQSQQGPAQEASFMPPNPQESIPQPPYPQQGFMPQPPYPPQGFAPQPSYPPQGLYSGVPYPTKRKRTGLVVGLILGAVVLAAAAVALFVWPGVLVPKAPAVGGFWISEDRGEALEFRSSGNVRVYTVDEAYKGTYQYDSANGMGNMSVGDKSFEFAMTKEGIKVNGMGVYEKAKDDFDVDAFIDDMAGAVSVTAQQPPSETQTQAIPSEAPTESALGNAAQNGDITGLWYETTGFGGTLEFFADGTYTMTIMGVSISGTYEYDAASVSWILSEELSGTTYTVTLTDEYLNMDTLQYTRDYVEPIDLNLDGTN